jgi:DNA-binding MarR family transcriptional regulator
VIVGPVNGFARLKLMDTAPTRLRSKASWLINKTSAHAHRLLGEALTPVEGRGHHFAVLAALDEFGPASQMAIGQRCGIDRSDTHATVSELVDQGFVIRAPDPDDRRRNVITITDAGRERLDDLDRVLSQMQDSLLSALSPDERRQLVALLTRVLGSQ